MVESSKTEYEPHEVGREQVPLHCLLEVRPEKRLEFSACHAFILVVAL